MENYSHNHNYIGNDPHISQNERKTFVVVVLTAIMMVIEITAGYLTGSMALLADGWHMASHATALGISVVTYRLAKSQSLQNSFSFGAGKFIPLGGYTSAIILALMAFFMAYESIKRLIHPEIIYFDQAIAVAIVGLVVNLVSAFILKESHHHDHNHDHNLKAAYLHVLADALTSILAIMALFLGKYYNSPWMDSFVGIVGSLVILRWAYGLCRETVWELLDGHAKIINRNEIRSALEDEETKVTDLHVWRIAPNAHACEIVIHTSKIKGPDFYKSKMLSQKSVQHMVIEENKTEVRKRNSSISTRNSSLDKPDSN